ncbi:D-alanyl-D-alanine carboxypeptidase family protein [Actinocorallia sp. A-T 12471]|uniref:D-alanyl-D-alanine carboxypeptidase family protein n=1 Tax=Actinocorallia sp. A-T 12471 TaxID=3089813 RepID=UPI0029D3ACF6|nr:serine hydrolase [Actinocorallia sp. A-T 12471]MDX6738711.1 serine hydrolase [Actinocorallia sp. A-T 12471]
MLKKLTATALAASMITLVPVGQAAAKPKAPAGVTASSAILFDATTGKVLWKRAPNKRMPVGSMNKVALAMVVLKRGDLSRKITIRQKYKDWVDGWGASNSHLVPGDVLTARQLLEAMLIESGSDAAYALAESYGGTGGFLGAQDKMNALAKKLGMTRTHYASFDGQPAKGDLTTAADQLKLARHAMKNKTFAKIVKTVRKDITSLKGRKYPLRTHNLLLKNSGRNDDNSGYPGLYGIKTGSTASAGSCFMFVARRKKHTVYGVVLKSSTALGRFQDAAKMLNWTYGTKTAVTLTPAPPRTAP